MNCSLFMLANDFIAAGIAHSCSSEHEKDRTPIGQDGLRNAIFYNIVGVTSSVGIEYFSHVELDF
jgi:hypothetical protein